MQPFDGWSFVSHLFSLRPAVRSGPGSYQGTAFALGPGAHEILCVPFRNESIPLSPVGLPQLSPIDLQSKCSGGLSSWCWNPGWGAWCRAQNSPPMGEASTI